MGLFTNSYRRADVIQKDMDTLSDALSSCDSIRSVYIDVRQGFSNHALASVFIDGRQYVMKIWPFE